MNSIIPKTNKKREKKKKRQTMITINTSKNRAFSLNSTYQDSGVNRIKRDRERDRDMVIRIFMEVHEKGKGWVYIYSLERYITFCQ